ncbi:11953_t:CDS:2, partial [Dentiscutata heterogama]
NLFYSLLNMSQSIVISHKDGNWNESKIYENKSNKTNIQLGTYNQRQIAELRKHRHLRNANIKNVITFFGVVRKPNDKICIVMEYASNENLQDYLSKNLLDWKLKTRWIVDISRGLLACHEHNIAHLDMKAKNIFVDHNLTVKIADFGFSYMKSGLDIGYENGGSLQWASPEYISDDPKMKEYYKDQPDLSDIYSFGLVAWEILMNGKEPYDSMDNDEIKEAKLSKNISGLIDDLKERDTPGGLRKVVEKCCNYNPPDRIALEEVELFLTDFK